MVALILVSLIATGCGEPHDTEASITTRILQGETRNLEFGGFTWRVLDIYDGKALIITENIIEVRTFHNKIDFISWETSDMRQYLNSAFLQNFTSVESQKIAETQIKNPNNLWFGSVGGNDTDDKVFLLSLEEADSLFGNSEDYWNRRYEDWFRTGYSNAYDSDRLATYGNGDKAWGWWLRSPGQKNVGTAYIDYNGSVSVFGRMAIGEYSPGGRVRIPKDTQYQNVRIPGVRPALWLYL